MTASLQHLDVIRQGSVATVRLNRPDVRNAFHADTVAELTQVFASFQDDAELRAVVLGSTGTAFCSGADLNWMRETADYTWVDNHRDASRLANMLWTLTCCPVPVIAEVQGDCYGGGVGLVLGLAVLIPLTYYLRDDPYDERFAWRMFSGVRLQECDATVFETRGEAERAVDPYQVVPAGWVTALALTMWLVFHFLLTRRTARLVHAAEELATAPLDAEAAPFDDHRVTITAAPGSSL